jgi:uncharacterized protein YjiS (DUF1127 family)
MNMFKAIAEALRRRRNMNNTINELHKMTDSELKDIGIPRCNIEQVVRGIVDIHRTVRDENEKGNDKNE